MSVLTREFTKIIHSENIFFGDPVMIDDFVLINARKSIYIGSYVHIAAFSSITGNGDLVMEDFSGLALGCRVLLSTDDFLGLSGLTNPTIPEELRGKVYDDNVKTTIGRHVIIGANSVIMPGVTIHEGCSIGANSLVNKDCEPWGIYVGNPIRRIKDRRRDVILDMERRLLEQPRCGRFILPIWWHSSS